LIRANRVAQVSQLSIGATIRGRLRQHSFHTSTLRCMVD
jgi:hypothetical protein